MTILSFGPFRLDPRTLELSKDGQSVAIRPQPCRVLAILASRPGELVTRAELAAALWPGVHVRVDLGLNSCLKQVRAAIGDDADEPRWIETLARRGYRFVGAVRRHEAARRSATRRLLVLPARAIAPDDVAAASLVAALNDEIETRLTRVASTLAVVPRASLPDALTSTPSRRGLAEAGVDLVLECRVHCAGRDVRLAVQLIDAVDRTLMWAEMIEGSLDDRFATQHAAARAISEGIKSTLGVRAEPHRLAG